MNIKKYFLYIYIFSLFIIVTLFIVNLYLALISLFIYVVLAMITIHAYKQMKQNLQQHEKKMFTQIEKASNQINEHMPIGVLIYTEQLIVEWVNSYIAKIYDDKVLIGQSIKDIFNEELIKIIHFFDKDKWLSYNIVREHV